jgi:hypothetical protein
MYFSPLPCYFVPLRPKYPYQHPILENPQRKSSFNMSDQVSHQCKKNWQILRKYSNRGRWLFIEPKHVASADKYLRTVVFDCNILFLLSVV